MKVRITLRKPADHPEPGRIVKGVFRNPDTGLEFVYPMEHNGQHWVARRAKEQRGFQTLSPGGVVFMGWFD